ncbi:3-mercaptopyruvate sulfurtransferase [Amorphus sp. 3PC139-8]|uniref:3-mercaptopyruvate sulfurtransferase n=1 Tax=Amorphus sp. 3PC139-8 TaxID=2735676 RepID=UPI00345DB2E3
MTALIEPEELAAALADPSVVVVDATFTMPGVSPTAAELYKAGHIPGARFFDIDAIADPDSALPHMLADPSVFETTVGAMGISNETDVIVYDAPGMLSAGRVWWNFRIMGHQRVRVLNGGLRAWRQEGRPVTEEVPVIEPATFRATFAPALLRNRQQLLDNVATQAEQVIDARAAERFSAEVPEPREGLRSGHIPGSLNVPSALLSDPESGRMKSPAELSALFEQAGLGSDRPIVTTCGSGVTAGALYFALHLIGRDDVAVYDGSWSEWGLPGETPVES